ncbi:MAG: YdeI/OmpD-associated family protein [Saprospiraceae bacterium]|nr:YdeI/OmpD-associated family protein [Saprospiraceae bacterium]
MVTFSPSSQREFTEYISEAKRDTTRKDRLQKFWN